MRLIMSSLGNIIKGIKKSSKFCSTNLFSSELDSSEFVTREEYEILKNLVIELKADIEKYKR
jgi:hypothetical protein